MYSTHSVNGNDKQGAESLRASLMKQFCLILLMRLYTLFIFTVSNTSRKYRIFDINNNKIIIYIYDTN